VSSHIEFALISRVIEDKDFSSLEKNQITADFFTVPEVRQVYEYLRFVYHHPQTTGMVPSLDMVRQYYPSFNAAYAPDEVPILCKALRDQKIRIELWGLVNKLTLESDKDPYAAIASLRSAAQSLAGLEQVSNDLSMSNAYQLLMDKYSSVSQAGGILGIPFPWEVLNAETQGLQNGQYIVLYGRPGSMKTWVALYMATHAYMQSRRRVLYYTREMPTLQIAQRVAATMCGVDYRAFKNGTLQPDLLAYAQSVLQGLLHDEESAGKHGHQPAFIITADRSANGGGVGWLQAKIKEVKPDIVFVDGVYLMKDDRSNQRTTDWKNILHISQDLRQTALGMNIPIMAITQANKQSDKVKGADFVDMAFTDAFNQDADAVFKIKHIMRRDDQGQKHSEIHMYSPKLREGCLDGIVINGTPCTDFSYIRSIIEEESEEEQYGAEGQKKQYAKAPTATFRKDAANYRDPTIPALK
jgi:replicative DNA helicase